MDSSLPAKDALASAPSAPVEPTSASPAPGPWMVFNVGCIECGVSSAVVGVFTDKAEADKLAAALDGTHGWRQGGQNAFEVFELPPVGETAAEYLTTPQ